MCVQHQYLLVLQMMVRSVFFTSINRHFAHCSIDYNFIRQGIFPLKLSKRIPFHAKTPIFLIRVICKTLNYVAATSTFLQVQISTNFKKITQILCPFCYSFQNWYHLVGHKRNDSSIARMGISRPREMTPQLLEWVQAGHKRNHSSIARTGTIQQATREMTPLLLEWVTFSRPQEKRLLYYQNG